MALLPSLSPFVPPEIQNRGRQYAQQGAVRIIHGNGRNVEATVQGSELYEVSLERAKETVLAWCSCPYCEDNYQPCKHIWATFITAERLGHLGATTLAAPEILEVDEAAGGEDKEGWGEEDIDDEDDFDEEPESYFRKLYSRPSPPPRNKGKTKRAPRAPGWKQMLKRLRDEMEHGQVEPRVPWPAGQEILYVVDAATSPTAQKLTLEVAQRYRKKDGAWSKPKVQRVPHAQLAQLPDPADREVLALLKGATEQNNYSSYYSYSPSYYDAVPCRYQLGTPLQETLVPLMCRTGRARLRKTDDLGALEELRWDEAGPWEFWLELVPDAAGKHFQVAGSFRRGEERLPLDGPALVVEGGLLFGEGRAAALHDFGAFHWITLLRKEGAFAVPAKQVEELLQDLIQLPRLPRLDLPEALRFEEVRLTPRPRLKVRKQLNSYWGRSGSLVGELFFDYDGTVLPADRAGRGVYQTDKRRLLLRDAAAEEAAAERLRLAGFRTTNYRKERELAARHLPRVVRTLTEEGWQVEAEGKVYRQPGNFQIEVNSGIDWFELHGTVDFGDTTAALPELLAAVKKGDNTVRLDDGTYGLLPEDWLKKYGLLAGLGKAEGDHLRFERAQVGLLDALLASQPEARCDEVFTHARDELRRFEGIEAADAPAGFVGELRGYQRDGLGWLHFLRRFGFGGCLADDMGLGKTVQVLALLESRRELRAAGGKDRPNPSLVVMPRSLVFNWMQEAARFTPRLKVLDHTGLGRTKPGPHFNEYDVVLTTYGTLRRDALDFKDVTFDYCILDEAQAVKNASTESAKAVRLLRANHRLALSGTPVENHLGELWSMFEFLNPGMLGAASVFQLGTSAARNPSAETRTLLAKALRPFILRRTKGQVAKDLPEKTEQTLYCELEAAERKRYDELRAHYRETLLTKVSRDGINRSKIQILEALLRLRQAACHPGLIDKKKTGEPSAKLEALLGQVRSVIEEDHKVLVFSQFTSLLAIVRDRLDKEKVPYEYLDGRTRDRAARVERFQNDPECKLFLVSLKAGGLGLNLTAAEYVFLLDPWWNPAVEAQAIDRAHRIGQTRQVFAYRLIAKDTVEEKVLELQQSKRALADAIINADNSLIRNLGREDLELLLS